MRDGTRDGVRDGERKKEKRKMFQAEVSLLWIRWSAVSGQASSVTSANC